MARATILLIEDSSTYVHLATVLLERVGYRIEVASTAEEGLEMAGRLSPDLVLMDMHLPGMDGLDAVRLLREDPETTRVPVVGLTAAAVRKEEEVHEARAAGFDLLVEKPTERSTFRELVGRFVADPAGESSRATNEGEETRP